MKRGIQALVIGVIVFIVLNMGFFVVPNLIVGILKPFYYIFKNIFGTLYLSLFSSEYREVVSISIIISIIITILSYFLMPDKNEK